MLEDLLKSKKCFKLICGAGKEDVEEIRRLVYLYAVNGCKFFDVSANEEVIDAAKEALSLANIDDAYLCVSIGLKGDPHSNKAVIDYSKCVNCGSCESICQEDAIHYAKVKKSKCIGCKRCSSVCPRNAISYVSEEKEIEKVIPSIVEKGIDCIEFHIMAQDENEILTKWEYLSKIYSGFLSICVSRGTLGDRMFIERLVKMLKFRKPYTTIIQADGLPMNGGGEDYNSTLQAVACAQIVQNAKLPAYIMLSGGTNTKTSDLAKLCNVSYNGIAAGSYARKLVRQYIQRPDFWSNEYIIDQVKPIITPLINC